MLPQILQQLGGGVMIPPQIKQMFQMAMSSGNPQAMIGQLLQTNPRMKNVMELIKTSGNDPKRAFYALAEQKGINPQDFLDQLR